MRRVACILLIAAVVPEVWLTAQTPAEGAGGVVFERPARRAGALHPTSVPNLPEHAESVPPLTFDVVTQRRGRTGPAAATRHVVSRTRDRIHLQMHKTEWLFARNPVDPRRVSALLVHHPSRTIVMHEESDLRNALGIGGWADVLMLGVDMATLRRLLPTTASRRLAGLRFTKRIARDTDGVMEVWWNEEACLPAVVEMRDGEGAVTVRVERLKPGVDAGLLRDPSARYSQYRVVDMAEWLEGH